LNCNPARAQANTPKIVLGERRREDAPEYGLTSFFVRGPDGLLVETVVEAPVPEGIWKGK